MTLVEEQLLATIKSLTNVIQMIRIYVPEDINLIIENHLKVTGEITKTIENGRK